MKLGFPIFGHDIILPEQIYLKIGRSRLRNFLPGNAIKPGRNIRERSEKLSRKQLIGVESVVNVSSSFLTRAAYDWTASIMQLGYGATSARKARRRTEGSPKRRRAPSLPLNTGPTLTYRTANLTPLHFCNIKNQKVGISSLSLSHACRAFSPYEYDKFPQPSCSISSGKFFLRARSKHHLFHNFMRFFS